ncbi:MAG: hypothetical protein WBC82_11210 [Dehalococcoidia bacterium]
MAKKVWVFRLEDGSHSVEFDHGYIDYLPILSEAHPDTPVP